MMDQIDLFSTGPSEEWVFEELKTVLSDTVLRNSLTPDRLHCEEGKQYSSVWYDSQMAFRICCRDGRHYFSVADAYIENAKDDISKLVTKTGNLKGFTNYEFRTDAEGIAVFCEFLSDVLDQVLDEIPKEFDCCSRYEECSNAKRCIHPNPDMAAGCGYRKIMKKGRIYYGQNRNV